MRHVFAGFFAALLIINISLSQGRADDISAAISGYVYNEQGIPIRNATVFAYSPSPENFYRYPYNGQAFEYSDRSRDGVPFAPSAIRFTDRDGFFVFLGMLPGYYTLIVRASGYYQGECSHPAATLYPNLTWRVRLRMERPSKTLDRCSPHPRQDFDISF